MKNQNTLTMYKVRWGTLQCLLLSSLLVLAVACSKGGTTGPEVPPDVAEVGQYLEDLPSWSQFSPMAPDQEPTATGEAEQLADETIDVEMVDSTGQVFTQQDVTYTCQEQPFTLTENPQQIAMYSPDREIVWAGGMIQGKSHRDGLGSLLGLPISERNPIRVSIPDLANDDNFRLVENPNQAEVDQAIGSMIGNATASGLSTPSSISFSLETYHQEQQASLQMGFSGRYMGFEGSASGSIDRKTSETTITAQFYQKMYTVVVEPPQSPGDFFSEDFTEERLQQQVNQGRIGPDNLPVYVSNIVYGRMMMFSLTSTASEDDIRATMQAGYESIGGSAQASLSAKQQGILQQSKINVTSIGGDAEATLAIIRSGDWSQYFTDNAELSSASPMSYTFRNLGDGSIASVTEATEYNIKSCSAKQATPGTFTLRDAQDLTLPVSTPASSFVADVDGDGNDDLIWNHLGSQNEVAIALSNGDGSFAAPASFTHPETAPEGWGKYTMLIGDFDNDERTDIMWNYDGTQNRFYVAMATGGGNFDLLADTTHPNSIWNEGYNKLIGDVDGDGDDDIVWNALGTTNRTYIGFSNGDGTFETPTTPQDHPNGGWGPYDVFLGDVNNDGKADMIWNSTNSSQNRTYVGLMSSTTPGSYYTPRSLQDRGGGGWQNYVTMVGDIDGKDGADLVFTELNFRDNGAIHRNISNGNGAFSFPSNQSFANSDRDKLIERLGDVNADGREDLIIYNQTLDEIHVGLGTSGGVFDFSRISQVRNSALDDWSQFKVLVGDFNGDSFKDIIWNDASSRNRVYVGIARTNQ
jgi:hypothetical protein